MYKLSRKNSFCSQNKRFRFFPPFSAKNLRVKDGAHIGELARWRI
ncbi:hypothetical protein WN943_014732 [Citrus x changshan-huyou]